MALRVRTPPLHHVAGRLLRVGEEKGRRTLMAKDRTRQARMRGRALEDRRRIEGAAARRRTMRAGRRLAKAMCATTQSLIDAMARGVDYIDWLLGMDGSE